MFDTMQIPTVVQFNPDEWANDQVKTLAVDDPNVTFDISTNTSYGYELFIDRSTAATPSADPPKQSGQMDFSVAGKCTITFTSPITAAQDGTLAKLRVFK